MGHGFFDFFFFWLTAIWGLFVTNERKYSYMSVAGPDAENLDRGLGRGLLLRPAIT